MIAEYIARETRSTIPEARRKIWMVDTGGLVTRLRAEKEDTLALHKLPYAHDGAPEVRIGPFPNPKSQIQNPGTLFAHTRLTLFGYIRSASRFWKRLGRSNQPR